MKTIDKYLAGETVLDCTKRFKAYLPPGLRPYLDDLVELYECMGDIISDEITEKGMRYFEKSFSRLAKFFKDNPLTEPADSSPLGKL